MKSGETGTPWASCVSKMVRVCLDIFVWPVWLSLLAPRIQLVLVFLSRYFAILAMGKTFQQVNETEHRLVKMMDMDTDPAHYRAQLRDDQHHCEV